VGHGTVEAVAFEVRARRVGWPAIKKLKKTVARESSYFHVAGCRHRAIFFGKKIMTEGAK